MNFSTVNEDALVKASTFLVGAAATNAIIGLYQLLDQAAKDGYELGKTEAQAGVEEAIDEAFDNGYEQGQYDLDLETLSDDAYLDGVRDARADPAGADRNVEDILFDRAQEALYDEGMFIDDETLMSDAFYYAYHGPEGAQG